MEELQVIILRFLTRALEKRNGTESIMTLDRHVAFRKGADFTGKVLYDQILILVDQGFVNQVNQSIFKITKAGKEYLNQFSED